MKTVTFKLEELTQILTGLQLVGQAQEAGPLYDLVVDTKVKISDLVAQMISDRKCTACEGRGWVYVANGQDDVDKDPCICGDSVPQILIATLA